MWELTCWNGIVKAYEVEHGLLRRKYYDTGKFPYRLLLNNTFLKKFI